MFRNSGTSTYAFTHFNGCSWLYLLFCWELIYCVCMYVRTYTCVSVYIYTFVHVLHSDTCTYTSLVVPFLPQFNCVALYTCASLLKPTRPSAFCLFITLTLPPSHPHFHSSALTPHTHPLHTPSLLTLTHPSHFTPQLTPTLHHSSTTTVWCRIQPSSPGSTGSTRPQPARGGGAGGRGSP